MVTASMSFFVVLIHAPFFGGRDSIVDGPLCCSSPISIHDWREKFKEEHIKIPGKHAILFLP